MFADELAGYLDRIDRQVIRASVDSFHNPRAIRYRRGRSSPEGFYRDSFDYRQLRSVLLDQLGPDGNSMFQRAVFDHRSDSPVDASLERAEVNALLIFDGIFLHRPELAGCFDFTVFLNVGFDVTFSRMATRDGVSPNPDAVESRRYVEGQRMYLSECSPLLKANLVVDNNDLSKPYIQHYR